MGQDLDIIIVGAGLGGLAAAIGISKAGHRVTILEQAEQLGEVRLSKALNIFKVYIDQT